MQNKILISFIHAPVETLGPLTRICIWFQGCSFKCSGCISPELQSFDSGHLLSDKKIKAKILLLITPDIDGITISGGEPFLQTRGLLHLVKWLKKQGLHDILIYSGYTIEEIRELEYGNEILNNITALIDGKFDERKETECFYKGSDNQKFYLLNTVYGNRYNDWIKNSENDRKLQVIDNGNRLSIIGIPKLQDAKKFIGFLKK